MQSINLPSSRQILLASRVNPRLSVVVVCYVLCCMVSFIAAYFALDRAAERHLNAVQNSTLFYASQDVKSATLANWIAAKTPIRIVDLLASGAGDKLQQLTGTLKATSPTLVLPQGEGVAVASGYSAVEQALQPVRSGITPMHRAQKALLLMAVLIGLACIFTTEIAAFTAFLPIIGLIAISLLSGNCWNCRSGGSLLSTLAPVLGLVYLGVAIALFTVPIVQHRAAYFGFGTVSALIPTIQAYMLVTEPKLCPSCLAITFVSAAYFIVTSKSLASLSLSGFASPKWVRITLVLSFGVLLLRHSLVLGGQVSVVKVTEFSVPRIIGTPLSKFVPSAASLQPGVLYVVTQEFCSACTKAEQDLNRLKIEWRKVPVCTVLASSGCFDGSGQAFPTPMLLMCDMSGRITFQRNGWVGSSSQLDDLIDQIHNAQRRVHLMTK